MECLLNKIIDEPVDVTIVGDFNVNMLSESTTVRRLNDILSIHDFTAHVNFATRVTQTSSTILDNCLSNIDESRISVRPVTTHVSDHLGQRIEIKCVSSMNIAPFASRTTKRQYTQNNIASFVRTLLAADWDELKRKHKDDAGKYADAIVNIMSYAADINFPLKSIPMKHSKHWVTNEILAMKDLLIDLYNLSNTFPDCDKLIAITDDLSKRYDDVLTQECAVFYSRRIEQSDNKAKEIWQIVRERTKPHLKVQNDFSNDVKKDNGSPFASKVDVVNFFNHQFANAAKLANAPEANLNEALTLLAQNRPACLSSIRFKRFTPEEVNKIIISQIAPKHTKDLYGTSCYLVRCAVDAMVGPLTDLYNALLSENRFPGALKNVKVTPIYKGKGKKENCSDYRPISIIPAAAKVLETGICVRLNKHFSETRALSDKQYAYRAGRSTIDLARELVWQVLQAREAGLQVAVISCDLSRAFDVCNHRLIEMKLHHYGVRGPVLSLMRDFMRDRIQTVVAAAGEVRSDPIELKIGVAQGSSVSNLTFSLLMNDLPESVPDAQLLMYADDVVAIVTAKQVEALERGLNDVAHKLAHWFKANGLALNPKKTNVMHFNLSGRRYPELSIVMEGETLRQVDVFTIVGFQIDRSLTWTSHIDALCDKLGRACFALGRVARVLSPKAVRDCYYATVQSLLIYGVDLWGCSSNWHRVFVMQKRAVRVVAQVAPRTPAKLLFKEHNLMTMPALYIYRVCIYVYKNLALYDRHNDVHNIGTRHSHRLVMPRHRLTKSSKCTQVIGVKAFNALPEPICAAKSLPSFKFKLRKFLTDLAPYSIEEFIPNLR